MSEWITDRTQSDVDHVKELHKKALDGTWTKEEQAEWASGMKGALNEKDFNRIEAGMKELAGIVNVSIVTRTNWNQNDYMTTSDALNWISNIQNIRSKCSGKGTTPSSPSEISFTFSCINQIEQILSDIENLAKTYVTFSGEYSCGEGKYGF